MTRFNRGQQACALAHALVQELRPAGADVGAHHRHGAAHGEHLVTAYVGEGTRLGRRGQLGSVNPQHELFAGEGVVGENFRVFQEDGAAVGVNHEL